MGVRIGFPVDEDPLPYAKVLVTRDARGVIDSHTDYMYGNELEPWIQDCLHRADEHGEAIVGNITINFKDGSTMTYFVNVDDDG